MANYYTSPDIANYNDDAPVDDGTESEANRVKWATVKNEIGDPLKTFAEAIDTELGNFENRMLFNGSSAQSTNYTITAANLGQRILASSAITVTALAAATATTGFVCIVINAGTATVTIAVQSGEALNGVTDGTIDIYPAEAVILFSDGAGWRAFGQRPLPVLATEQATTSGTEIDFTSAPAWAKEIKFQLLAVSTNGTSVPTLQIGTGGAPEATGYTSRATNITTAVSVGSVSNGFALAQTVAADTVLHGHAILTLEDATANTWMFSATLAVGNSAAMTLASGSKSLAGTLDMIRLTTGNGTDLFDAGAVNVLYS